MTRRLCLVTFVIGVSALLSQTGLASDDPQWDSDMRAPDFYAKASHAPNADSASIRFYDPTSNAQTGDIPLSLGGPVILGLDDRAMEDRGRFYFYWRKWEFNGQETPGPVGALQVRPSRYSFGQVVLIRFLETVPPGESPFTPRKGFIQLAKLKASKAGTEDESPWMLDGSTTNNPLYNAQWDLPDGKVLFDAPGAKVDFVTNKTTPFSTFEFTFETWFWGTAPNPPPPDRISKYLLGHFRWKFKGEFKPTPGGGSSVHFAPLKSSVRWYSGWPGPGFSRYVDKVLPYGVFLLNPFIPDTQ